jgi:hypothetical protein
MHNTGQMICQIFINILDRRRLALSFFHTITRVRWQQNISGKWLYNLVHLRVCLSNFEANILIPFPTVKTYVILNYDGKNTLYYAKFNASSKWSIL